MAQARIECLPLFGNRGGNRKNKIWVHTVFSKKVCKINENKPSQDHIGLYSMVQSVQLKSGLSDKQNLALDECC